MRAGGGRDGVVAVEGTFSSTGVRVIGADTNVGVGGGHVYGGVYRHRWAVRAQSGLADWEQVNGAQRAR